MKHVTLFDGVHLGADPRSEVLQPTLLRYDLGPETVTAFLADLARPDWRDRLRQRAQLETRKGLPVVDQAVHRKACLVVADAACLVPGFPRLDPGKVHSAGFVIRRLKTGSTDSWMKGDDGLTLGWLPAPASALRPDCRYEPDMGRRREAHSHANPVLLKRAVVTSGEDNLSETTHPMFPVPPAIAEKIGRTLYFAVIPATSMAISAAAAPPPFTLPDVAARLPNLLRHQRNGDPLPPVSASLTADLLAASGEPGADPGMAVLRSVLTWLGQETGLFTGEPYSRGLRDALAAIAVSGPHAANLFAWFEKAQSILAERQGGPSLQLPDSWPPISATQQARILDGAFAAMTGRWSSLAPSVSRFGPIGDRYAIRCFLRLDESEDCPPHILWSPLSAAYTIRPWYESGGAAAQIIELPPLNLQTLKAMKPDIAVKVPPEIQQFMDRINMDGLLKGKSDKNPNVSFGMICGFSIPIITICAFIILQLFLNLLNILFFWLPFVKICIPYPIVNREE